MKWVVFDAVGTLMYPCPGVPLAYHEIGRRYGSRLSEKVVRERLSVAFGSVVRPRGDRTSADDEQAWWRRVVAATLTDVSDPAATFDSLWANFAAAQSWCLYGDVAAGVAAVADRGLRAAIASNFDARLGGIIGGHAELDAVRPVLHAAGLGWRKPARQFFDTVCRELGCTPDAVLYVGDDPHGDVAPARAAGMRALLVARDGGGDLRSLAELVEHL